MMGIGFGITLTVTAFEGRVPGLLTVMESWPTAVRFAAGRAKNNTVGPAPTLLTGLPLFTCIVDDGVKLLPVILTTVSGELMGIELGLMLESTGTG